MSLSFLTRSSLLLALMVCATHSVRASELAAPNALEGEARQSALSFPQFEIGFGLHFNSRRAVDGRSFEFEYPPVVSAGLSWPNLAVQLDRVDVESSDGNASLAVSRRREAWLLSAKTWWGENTWRPVASIGWGVSREHVATRVSSASADTTEIGTGVWTGYFSGAAGLRAEIRPSAGESGRLAIDVLARGESSPQYGVFGKNNPRWGAGLQVFYAFN
ncbi:MAG TPA: hypothetical protein PLZ57_05020 [Pseudobdellovibrionaceae bacterium]|nr:hypothetical protein [Pseudobdellovibrionaceae bacterium]